MKRKLLTIAVSCFMTASLCMPVLAGEWKQNETGWLYQNDDGSYLNAGWSWVDGRCYYFTPEGCCLVNTQTPDGNRVDGSGAWIVNGIVQTPEMQAGAAVQAGGFTFTAPAGFHFDSSDEKRSFFVNDSGTIAIEIMSDKIAESEEEIELMRTQEKALLDELFLRAGTPAGIRTVNAATGTWYCYDFLELPDKDVYWPMRFYGRFNSGNLELVTFTGEFTNLDTDKIMNENLR